MMGSDDENNYSCDCKHNDMMVNIGGRYACHNGGKYSVHS